MSVVGSAQLQLRAAQRARIANVRRQREVRAEFAQLSAELTRPRSAGFEAMIDDERGRVQQGLSAEASRISTDVTAAAAGIAQLARAWADIVVKTMAKADAWSAARERLTAQVEAAATLMPALETASAAARVAVAQATQALQSARGLAANVDEAGVEAALETAADAVRAAQAADQAEAERREAVSGLVKTLQHMGFVVTRPRLRAEDDVVALEGRLPSGRRASFEIGSAGALDFDLDGYPGSGCKEDLDRVAELLAAQFGARMGPPQFEWKNPDRILKGAKSLPGDGPIHCNKTGGHQ